MRKNNQIHNHCCRLLSVIDRLIRQKFSWKIADMNDTIDFFD